MTTNEKTRHNLYTVQGPEELLAGLRAANVDIVAELEARLPNATDLALLAVGSIPEGNASAVSDLDFLALVKREEVQLLPNDLSVTAGYGHEIGFVRGGLDLNIEVVDWQEIRPLRRAMAAMSAFLRDPGSLASFPFLERFDLRLLHRLATGWPLSGAETILRWRTLLGTAFLPTYLAIKNLTVCYETLEDACEAISSGTVEAVYTGRNCTEYALLGFLALCGYTSQTRRFLFKHAARLKDPAHRALANRGVELLFPSRYSDVAEQRAYLSAVHAFAEAVAREAATSSEEMAAVISSVSSRTAYVFPDWIEQAGDDTLIPPRAR